MAWNFSTGLSEASLAGETSSKTLVAASTISMGDGDGTGGRDTINDTGSGLAVFGTHAFILIQSEDANNNVLVKALNVVAGIIEVAAGSFAAVAAGSVITLMELSGGGSLAQLFRNGVIDIYTGARPANADATEGTGTHLLRVSLNGDSFAAGVAENGINMGDLVASVLKRMTDPDTAIKEVWKGTGIATGVAGWARWYDNSLTTGASESAIRMDGVVSVSGAEVSLANGTTVTITVASEVTDVSFTSAGV